MRSWRKLKKTALKAWKAENEERGCLYSRACHETKIVTWNIGLIFFFYLIYIKIGENEITKNYKCSSSKYAFFLRPKIQRIFKIYILIFILLFNTKVDQIDLCHIYMSYASYDMKCHIMTNDAYDIEIWHRSIWSILANIPSDCFGFMTRPTVQSALNMLKAKQMILKKKWKQAGAELCQAQFKFG